MQALSVSNSAQYRVLTSRKLTRGWHDRWFGSYDTKHANGTQITRSAATGRYHHKLHVGMEGAKEEEEECQAAQLEEEDFAEVQRERSSRKTERECLRERWPSADAAGARISRRLQRKHSRCKRYVHGRIPRGQGYEINVSGPSQQHSHQHCTALSYRMSYGERVFAKCR